MFLPILPNPHSAGRLTRSILFQPSPGQTYAIDAERLYREPELLRTFDKWSDVKIRGLDLIAYALLILGVLGSFFAAWWLWAPGVAICALMLTVNRKSAGDMARSAALGSNEDFLYLHSIGALWLVRR